MFGMDVNGKVDWDDCKVVVDNGLGFVMIYITRG